MLLSHKSVTLIDASSKYLDIAKGGDHDFLKLFSSFQLQYQQAMHQQMVQQQLLMQSVYQQQPSQSQYPATVCQECKVDGTVLK